MHAINDSASVGVADAANSANMSPTVTVCACVLDINETLTRAAGRDKAMNEIYWFVLR